MDIIANIINTVPEPLATAILTATFTGIIILYLQKRIENSFAEKLEEYKTNLQKSSTEHQIKFSKTYPKTLEVLETGYQKFRDLSQHFQKIHSQTLNTNQPLDLAEIRAKIDESIEAVREYTTYFQNNRLYLPDELIAELEKINSRVGVLGLASMGLLGYSSRPPDSLIKQTDTLSKMIGRPIDVSMESEEPDEASSKRMWFYMHSGIIDMEFTMLSQEFEKLYKSVAEAQ
jgi:hypothetical protein